jgi:hypothetical protein
MYFTEREVKPLAKEQSNEYSDKKRTSLFRHWMSLEPVTIQKGDQNKVKSKVVPVLN